MERKSIQTLLGEKIAHIEFATDDKVTIKNADGKVLMVVSPDNQVFDGDGNFFKEFE